ncbi:MAG: aminotransferase class V-fold PLP-dependent enzyme [Cytophagales bacterium]|nr:aminotransferase class V-fold PLP-dependent enzyme [Cytophagales bacterium]
MKELLKPATGRRNFLRKLAAGTAMTMTLPSLAIAGEAMMVPLPVLDGEADERYWSMVKNQFAVPDQLMMLNAANLCPAPYAITQAVQTTLGELGRDVSFQSRDRFDLIRQTALEKLAAYLGVSKDEVGITRNTSESNNIIVNGFDFKAGDEVILWDQNHPSNMVAWEQRARRLGFTIRKVSVPAAPLSPDDLMAPFVKAVTPKTRLIAFSHISNLSGIAMPAKALCNWAREKKILTLVDGAQSFGLVDLDLKDMSCDFYSGSTHKWLLGPLENGVLYVRKENMERLWPTMISAGWKDGSATADEKYCIAGQRNETTPAAIPETIDFHLRIGKRNVEERVRALNGYLRAQLALKLPRTVFVSPPPGSQSGGITVFNIPGKASAEMFQKLYDTYGMACASTMGVRISPHIYNTLEDIDKVVDAVLNLADH